MISQIYETENSNYSNVFRNCINSVQKLLANRNTDDAFRYVSSSKGKLSMEKEKIQSKKKYVRQWTKSNMKTVSVSYKTEFVTEFREACEKLGIKQSAVFREAMEAVIEKAKKTRANKPWSFLMSINCCVVEISF